MVAAYNAERWLARTLESIVAQTFDEWRCVVVDDGSKDATPAVASSFADRDGRFSLVRQANGGPSEARNAGLAALGTVDEVAFVDSDDLWLPEALITLVEALRRRPDAVGVAGLAELIDEEDRPLRPGAHSARLLARRQIVGLGTRSMDPAEDITIRSLALSGSVWPPAIALWRADAVRQAGGFPAELGLSEDWELWIRLSRLGPIASEPIQVAWYREHSGNLTGDHVRNLMAQALVRRRVRQPGVLDEDGRRTMAIGGRLVLVGGLHAQLYGLYRAALDGRVRCLPKGVLGLIVGLGDLLRPHRLVTERGIRRRLALRVEANGAVTADEPAGAARAAGKREARSR